jgi:hypothetical protein
VTHMLTAGMYLSVRRVVFNVGIDVSVEIMVRSLLLSGYSLSRCLSISEWLWFVVR